jgi:hypothetical protein
MTGGRPGSQGAGVANVQPVIWPEGKLMSACVRRWGLLSAVAGTLVLCDALASCASSRVLKSPLPTTTPDLGWTASAADGQVVELHQLIVRNGGGSWVRDANWDEYVLTIRNDSMDSVEIERIDLYSDKLPTPEESSTSREQLDAQSNHTLRAMKDVGVVAGAGVLVPTALVAGTMGAAGGSLAAVGAAATVAVVAVPVGLIGGTVYVVRRHHRDTEDKVLIEHLLIERGFGVPVQILPGMQILTSAFFPLTPAPTRLVIQYAADGDAREIRLDLPALAGLHLKAVHATSAANAAPERVH